MKTSLCGYKYDECGVEEDTQRETNGRRERKDRKTNYQSLALNQGTSLRGRRPQINPVHSTDSWVLASDDMMWRARYACLCLCVCMWLL